MPARLRPLGVMILALLREREMHPYEMLRLLRERRDERLVPIQQGTFYHQVAALERDGLIRPVAVEREGNRPERTTYAITAAGDAAVLDWVRAELPGIASPVNFRVALAESHNLDRDTARTLLARRLELLREAYADRRARIAEAAARAVPRQFLVEVEREIALMSADIAWTESLLAELGGAEGVPASGTELPWGIPGVPARPEPHETSPRKEGA